MLATEYVAKEEPDLPKALETYGDSLSAKFNSHRVGRIVKFYPDRLTVDVELLDKIIFRDTIEDYSIIPDLPLVISGAKNTYLTFGDVTGTEVIVHFNDTDIDNWFKTGQAYEPNTARQHDFSDGFAELSIHSLPNVFEYDITGTVLNRGNFNIKLTDEDIQITNGEASIVLNGNNITITGNITLNGSLTATGTISSDTDVLSAGISGKTHTHTSAAAGSPTSAPN